MNTDEAKRCVEVELNKDYVPDGCGPLVVLDECTKKKAYGWVFTVNIRRFVETGNLDAYVIGLGPVVLIAEDKSIHILGSWRPGDEEIADFELRFGKKGQ